MGNNGDLVAERYRLVSRVGSGAMGVVWRAEDTLLHRDVAVKELLVHPGMSQAQSDEARRRAMREGRIAARLHHPNATAVYDVVQHEGRPCLIMEYLPSQSLADLLAAQPVLPAARVARIGVQLAAALAAAQKAGVVHRDVKPANVLLAADGTVKLTDFGISQATTDGTMTGTGLLAGTPAYLAPEIARGQEGGFASDVFSLGATLYAAVEGAPPFGVDSNPIALLHRIATQEATEPAQAGPLTAPLVAMLRQDPEDRPTAQQVHEVLSAVVEAAAAEVPAAAAPDQQRRRRVLLLAAAAVVVVIGLAVVVVLNTPNQSPAADGQPPAVTTGSAKPTTTAPTTTTTTTTTTQQPPPSTTTPSTTTAAPQDLSAQLTSAITSYYGLVPHDLAQGWNRMTAGYQQGHAGGYAGYQGFWQQYTSASASDVVASPPDRVTATIAYVHRDGHVTQERTQFGLVQQDGQWKIASSAVVG
ncbi:hypothetical protein GCM10010174_79720 [Kutzneria viridogrisea]|uniref:non-specific serine/threonine protein kinase n=2 Tax=Kutzneria TaxID=43356 RepID=W5WBB6_9PSEU|nr:serine/threonine-protein kinase [Kutzneria albida]AHH98137.1 hypothetical protein KALB_4775 [Kutzneria albida DSM 43870]MBA8924180.1 serine/threonine protein kinase [Kutzneria viridogrisea]